VADLEKGQSNHGLIGVARVYDWEGTDFSIADADRFLLVLQLKFVVSAYCTPSVPFRACLKLLRFSYWGSMTPSTSFGYAHAWTRLRVSIAFVLSLRSELWLFTVRMLV